MKKANTDQFFNLLLSGKSIITIYIYFFFFVTFTIFILCRVLLAIRDLFRVKKKEER